MWKNKKIQSFTISEMLVVMVLTTLVISIAILVLNLIQHQLSGIQQNFKNNTELSTFEQVIWQDFSKNEIFIGTKSNQIICMSPVDTISYQFEENYILRNADTIKIAFEGRRLFLDMNQAEAIIDAIELDLTKEFRQKQLFIYKTKAASYYMNKNGI